MVNTNADKTELMKEKLLIDDARTAIARNDYSYAQACCKLAIDINGNSFNAHFLYGCTLYFNGDLDSARKEFSKAIKLNPKSQLAKINKGVIELQMGHLSGIGEIEKMNHDYTNCAKIFELKAIFSAQCGDYELSDVYFEKAKDLFAAPSIYTNHGTALLEKYLSNHGDINDLHKALEMLDYAIANSEFDKYAYYNRCRIYIILNRYKKAIADAKKLVAYDEKDPGFLYILAKTQMLCGQYDKATENAFYAHWYGSLFNSKVADEALVLCDEIVEAKKANLCGNKI